MKIRSEAALYREVQRATNRIYREMFEKRKALQGRLDYQKRSFDGRTLYLLGEEHCAIKPVDYTHEHIAPFMKKDPTQWMVFREGNNIPANLSSFPMHFYFKTLARVFKVPCEDALADIYLPETREQLRARTGISEVELDKLLMELMLTEVRYFEASANPKRFVKNMAMDLCKPEEYVIELWKSGPATASFDNMAECWNDISKERFQRILTENPDRTNALVSFGYRHMPAFELGELVTGPSSL